MKLLVCLFFVQRGYNYQETMCMCGHKLALKTSLIGENFPVKYRANLGACLFQDTSKKRGTINLPSPKVASEQLKGV